MYYKILILFISFLFSDVFEGYTLYTTDSPYTTYLIDNEENIINVQNSFAMSAAEQALCISNCVMKQPM